MAIQFETGRRGESADFVIPATPEQLRQMIVTLFGYIPADRVSPDPRCADHTPPMTALWRAYRGLDPFAVWLASRGYGGKSVNLAILSALELLSGMDVNLLGGSMVQSQNVYSIMDNIWNHTVEVNGRVVEAPFKHLLEKRLSTITTTIGGNSLKVLPASQTSVRGPHPQRLNLDEIDELDLKIFDASMGQPMSGRGWNPATIASSTWQNPSGTMTEVLRRSRENNTPVYRWCYRESLVSNGGWLSDEEVELKKLTIPRHMWETEYELQEPSPESRAIMPEAVEKLFSYKLDEGVVFDGGDGEYIEIEEPEAAGRYATGADWAKAQDWTVIATFRYDVRPVRLVAFERMHRQMWPAMVARFNQRLNRFPGLAAHDALGVGGVVSDYLEHKVWDVHMIGRERVDLFSDYIVSVEREEITAPRIRWAYDEHRYAARNDLFGPGHPPDSIVAMSVAWSQAKFAPNIPLPIGFEAPSLWRR